MKCYTMFRNAYNMISISLLVTFLRVARINRIQVSIILNRNLRLRPVLIHGQRAILPNQMPLCLVIRGWLACHNRMLPNLVIVTLRRRLIDLVRSVRVTRVFLIQRPSRKLAPVKTRRLLRLVVSEADGDKLTAVRGAEVETVGCRSIAKNRLLEGHDRNDGFDHRLIHLGEGVFFLPGVLGATSCQVGDV